MLSDKNTKYKFEILTSSPEDHMFAAGAYYIVIRDQSDALILDTGLSHRFVSVADARDICKCVESGKISVHQLVREATERVRQMTEDHQVVGKQQFEEFLHQSQKQGIAPDTLFTILQSYNQLSPACHDLLKDEQAILSFMKEHPLPKVDRKTFGQWMEEERIDVSVYLVDADAVTHSVGGVSYLSEEAGRELNLQYSDLERWLFSLPFKHFDRAVPLAGYEALVFLETDFSYAQIDFLLQKAEFGLPTQEWNNLYDRATWADADFKARLDYLKDGTPFEVPFDRDCMDAASPSDRLELCRFLDAHPESYVTPGHDNGLRFVYSVAQTPDGTVEPVNCPVCAVNTERGRGLSSTLESITFGAWKRMEQPPHSISQQQEAQRI